MVPTFVADRRVALVAAADPRAEARAHFAKEFSAAAYDSIAALCADPQVEAIYIATPHQFHAEHAKLAAQHGKHLLIEKPLAITLDECRSIVDAAQRAGVQLIVGHSHSFDVPIARTRELIAGGRYGAVRMITALNYTDFLYRPRRPEELDTTKGGGVAFSQAAHQVDIIRRLGGGRVRSVRAITGAWDDKRPTEGAYAALLTFESGAFASLNYNGYGNFDSDEFQGWVGELGQRKDAGKPRPRRSFASAAEEAAAKNSGSFGGAAYQPANLERRTHQHFGTIIVSCERADLRPMPDGVMIYQDGVAKLDPLPPPAVPRAEVVDELYDAVVNGRAPLHDGAWATATLEVCLALLASAREGRDVALAHQVALR
jgi:phthalate 4,5-cis-dihydrodiol dehydrogenase